MCVGLLSDALVVIVDGVGKSFLCVKVFIIDTLVGYGGCVVTYMLLVIFPGVFIVDTRTFALGDCLKPCLRASSVVSNGLSTCLSAIAVYYPRSHFAF